jgi:5-methylcytosine-specific restriction enzyme A
MPIKKPCAQPGCSSLVLRGYCDRCAPKHNTALIAERARPSAAARGYGRRWQKTSAARLDKHPWCVDPYKVHKLFPEPATVTDHVIPHKGNMTLFWDPTNWQSLCDRCHNTKTAFEDGGFGVAVPKG